MKVLKAASKHASSASALPEGAESQGGGIGKDFVDFKAKIEER